MKKIFLPPGKKDAIIEKIKSNHKFLQRLKYLGMDHLHGEMDPIITTYVNKMFSAQFTFTVYESEGRHITILKKKELDKNETLNEFLERLCKTIFENKTEFKFEEYMLHLKKNLHELTEHEIIEVFKKKRELIFKQLEERYFRLYLGITTEAEETAGVIVKIRKKIDDFKKKFEFDETKIYLKDGKSYFDEYKDNLPDDKPIFHCERDNRMSCNKADCDFNAPFYMPEYNYYSTLYDTIHGIPTTEDEKKAKAFYLSKFRIGILGDNKLIKDDIKDSIRYMGEEHFSDNKNYFSDEDIAYYNSLPQELKWNRQYNKLFIQLMALRNLIFPFIIKMQKVKDPFIKLSDYIEKINSQKKEYDDSDIHAILFYELNGNLFVFYVIENKLFGNIILEPYETFNYKIFNSWGHETFFDKNDIPSHLRVQYLEMNMVYHVMRTSGGVRFYKTSDGMILASKYSLDEIKKKYIMMKMNITELEQLEEQKQELCNHKLTNRSGVSLFEWQINNDDKKFWGIKKGKTQKFPTSDKFFESVSPKCLDYKNKELSQEAYFYKKYIIYKNKYLKLKSMMK